MNCRDGFSDQCWNLVSPNTGERRDPPTKTWCDSQRQPGYARLDAKYCQHLNMEGQPDYTCPNCGTDLTPLPDPEIDFDERDYSPEKISVREP